MNVDRILEALNQHDVAFMLIGGMNFLLRHEPMLTYDVDIWIDDTEENRARCERTLASLDAEWGATEKTWSPVSRLPPGWLSGQPLFCLTSPHGSLDIFRSVRGLDDWRASFQRAVTGKTESGVSYHGISDADMLRCQEALPEQEQKKDRISVLQKAMRLEGHP